MFFFVSHFVGSIGNLQWRYIIYYYSRHSMHQHYVTIEIKTLTLYSLDDEGNLKSRSIPREIYRQCPSHSRSLPAISSRSISPIGKTCNFIISIFEHKEWHLTNSPKTAYLTLNSVINRPISLKGFLSES